MIGETEEPHQIWIAQYLKKTTALKTFLMAWVLGTLASAIVAQAVPVCDVRTFGAKGDGVSSDTKAVANAIAACAQQGGGTVYFSAGRYLVGTLQIYSHIHLQLEAGAALVGSQDVQEYLASPPFGFARHYGIDITGEGELLGMLIAKNAEDISIDGGGEIDGQGDSFMELQTAHDGHDYVEQYVRDPKQFHAAMSEVEYGPVEPGHRPGTMIVFFHCSNVRLHGITLRAAPNWTLHLQDVQDAAISDIQILNNPRIPNNDGIDCMQCRHVRISNCHIDTGDDGFAIVGSEHVNVSNCSISSRSAAIRLESTKLSTFTGLSIDTNRGIAVFAASDKGGEDRSTEGVIFSDIVMRTRLIPGNWWGKAEPIYIAVQPCLSAAHCGVKVRNVVFHDITAEAENGSLLWGAEGSPITGVEFDGVRLHIISPNPELAKAIGGNLDLRWTAVSPRYGIVKSEIAGFFATHVEGLVLHDVHIDWPDEMPQYFSDGLRVEDFKDLTIDHFSGRQAQKTAGAAVYLRNGSEAVLSNSRATLGTRVFLQRDHVRNLRTIGNYENLGERAVRFATSPQGTVQHH